MTHYPFKAKPLESFEEKFEEIPAGSYLCEIIKIELMTTKDGHGTYIAVRFKIKDGEFKGRIIYQNFNTKNRSTQAVKIGEKHLSMLCYSIGIESWEDLDELLNYETIVKLDAGNKLYGFDKIESSTPEFPDNSNVEEPPIIGVDDFVDDNIPF